MPSLSEQLLALAPALGATITDGPAPANLRMTHGAHVVRMMATDGKHPALMIEVDSPVRGAKSDELLPFEVPEPPLIELVREGSIHRAGKALRLNREVQSGDPTFDAAVYIHANRTPDEYIRHIVQHPGVRAAAISLLQAGYDQVTLDGHAHGGLVRVSRGHIPRDGADDTLRQEIAWMATIAATLPACTPRAPTRRTDLAAATGIAIGVWAFVSIFYAVLFDHMWPIHGPHWNTPWAISAMSWLAAIPMLILWLRGSSRALHTLLISAALLLVALPCSLNPTLRGINALADTSTKRIVPVHVVSLRVSKGSKSTTYHATLDMRDGVTPKSRSISWNDYRKLTQCQPDCVAVMGDGAFGWAWIDAFETAR